MDTKSNNATRNAKRRMDMRYDDLTTLQRERAEIRRQQRMLDKRMEEVLTEIETARTLYEEAENEYLQG